MRSAFAAGIAAQGLASAVTLSLSILAGQAAGPSGLGTAYVGFAAYLAALALQRAFVTTPLITSSSSTAGAPRSDATSSAQLIVGGSALLATALFLGVGFVVGGSLGRGLVYFAPWLVPALLLQFWRAVLFRDGRPWRAVVSDLAWLGVIVAAAPFALSTSSTGVVIAAWGAGALVAAVLAGAALRQRFTSPRRAAGWWRDHAARFGSWLALYEVVFIAAGYGTVAVLLDALGSAGLGGLKAAESVFAPMSLLAPALVLPALPAMVRVVSGSQQRGRRFAFRLSLIATLATAAYVLVAISLSSQLLGTLFGTGFSEYAYLVWPLGAWQVLASAALGFGILLQAEQRGRAIAVSGVLGPLATLVLVLVLAPEFGARGAAWSYAIAAFLASSTTIWFALRPERLRPRSRPRTA
jgi:O-antigen/teichoic acid export membrane protein